MSPTENINPLIREKIRQDSTMHRVWGLVFLTAIGSCLVVGTLLQFVGAGFAPESLSHQFFTSKAALICLVAIAVIWLLSIMMVRTRIRTPDQSDAIENVAERIMAGVFFTSLYAIFGLCFEYAFRTPASGRFSEAIQLGAMFLGAIFVVLSFAVSYVRHRYKSIRKQADADPDAWKSDAAGFLLALPLVAVMAPLAGVMIYGFALTWSESRIASTMLGYVFLGIVVLLILAIAARAFWRAWRDPLEGGFMLAVNLSVALILILTLALYILLFIGVNAKPP